MKKQWPAVCAHPLVKFGLVPGLFLMMLVACKGQSASAASVQGTMQLVLRDYYGGYENDTAWVVKNDKDLHRFMAQVNKTRKPGLPIPEVDFSEYLVLIACGGTQSTKELDEIVCLDDNESEIRFSLSHRKENREPHGLAPFYIQTLPITHKAIVFTH